MTRRMASIAAIAAITGVCAATIWVYVKAPTHDTARPAPPGETSAEAGFARDMAVHHSQAVEMADLMRTRTTDAELIILCTDIVLTQQNQIGRFYGWLDQWDLPATNPTPMAWMNNGHSGMAMSMPGMATRAEVAELSTLPIADAEIAFLRLLIRHHRGGVEMAKAIVQLTDRPEVLRAANAVQTSQNNEIDVMNTMLATRGEAPE
jgi:uncharacterized protein (DUF305 family)